MKVYTRGSGTCAAVNCWNNYKNCKHGFYRFPANATRAKLWAIATGRQDLCSTTDSLKSLHKTHRICSSHFKSCMVIGGNRKRLVHHAIPTIFLTKSSNFHLNDHNYYRPVMEINIDELLCQINEKDNDDVDEISKIIKANNSSVVKDEEAETGIKNIQELAKIKLEPEELIFDQEILIKDELFDEHDVIIKTESFSDNEKVEKNINTIKMPKNDNEVKKFKHLEKSLAKITKESFLNQEEISIKDEPLDEYEIIDELPLHIKDEPTDTPEEDDSSKKLPKLSSIYTEKPPILKCGTCKKRSAYLRYKINNHFRLLFHGDSD